MVSEISQHTNAKNNEIHGECNMKRIFAMVLVFALMLCFSSCVKEQEKYSEEDFIGLSSKEIEDKFGTFDHRRDIKRADGLYRFTKCGYMVSEGNFFEQPVYFMIHFDGHGLA